MKKWNGLIVCVWVWVVATRVAAVEPLVPDGFVWSSPDRTGEAPAGEDVVFVSPGGSGETVPATQDTGRPSKPVPHRLLTCNIRVSTLDEDARKGYGWEVRKKICLQVIRGCRPDLICMQEVVPQSYRDLAASLDDFGSSGFAGPDMDRHPEGYHGIAKNVIFYRKKRYELVASGTYWLSETPLLAGSGSWGTARPRQCNWVRLRDKRSGREFRVVNLHLDHKSSAARVAQVAVALGECAQYAPGFPQLMAGDFNSTLSDAPVQNVLQAGWTELYLATHGGRDSGYTYHGFLGDDYPHPERRRIDFIFFCGDAAPVAAELVKDRCGGLYPSDHYFIRADVSIP